MSRKIISLICIITCILLQQAAYSQFNPRLVSITNPQSGQNPSTFKFGSLVNIKLAYQVNSPNTNTEAIEYLKNYALLINSRTYPELSLKKMRYFSNVKEPSAGETLQYSIVFQGSLPPAQKDTTKTLFIVSDFWRHTYMPFKSERFFKLSLISDRAEQSTLESNRDMRLIFYSRSRGWLFLAVFGALLAAVLWLSSQDRFKMLRDDKTCEKNPANSTFSLSKVQLLIWTFVILGMIAYQWTVTGYFPQLTSAHLVLLGIAAGQRLLARAIDINNEPKKSSGIAAQGVLPPADGCSRGFFVDLISDNTGLSISRLQYVIITFIFVVMFVTDGLEKLELMGFSVEQLALMGTSAGLYLWNKKLDQ